MKTVTLMLLGLLALSAPSAGQEPCQAPANPCAGKQPDCGHENGESGLHWTIGCFPRCGCPDDYCPNPLPRQCWPPYPPFYRCVPAGECCPAGGKAPCKDKLTWWFLPTPRALREALWCSP